MKRPLEGVKVASFAWIAAGPLAVRYLAMWGATVVKVETHTRPDIIRLMAPYKDGKPGLDRSAWFANINTSVYSASLNLSKPKGIELAWRLLKWADVTAENFGAGTMRKWGLDYASVAKVRPDIIYLSSTNFGQGGPYEPFVGHGWTAGGLGGLTYVTGWPDRPPATYHAAYTDFVACRSAAAAVLAALDYRRRTGKGQLIDVSQVEGCLDLLAPIFMDAAIQRRNLKRSGNSLAYAAPHGVYPCHGEERWCALAVFTQEQWKAFCRVIGHPEWSEDGKFATFLGRKESEAELDRLVAGWTIEHAAEEVEALLQSAGVPCSVVESVGELFEDPQIRERGFFRYLKHSVMGEHAYRGPAFKLSKTTDGQFPGPGLGEHNEYVLKELLRMSDDEISDAYAEGAITTEADTPAMSLSTL